MSPKYICELKDGRVVLVDLEQRRADRQNSLFMISAVSIWILLWILFIIGVTLWGGK